MTTEASSAVRPRAGVHLLTSALGDSLLVFDPGRLRAHVLNSSAVRVWADCDGSRSIEEIVAAITSELQSVTPSDPGMDPAAVEADVAGAVHLFRLEGLVDTDDGPVADPGPRRGFHNVPHTGDPAPERRDDEPWASVSGTYTGLDFTFRVATDDVELGSYAADVLGPLTRPMGAASTAEESIHRYDITVDRRGMHLIALDGFVVSRDLAARLVAETLFWHVNQAVSSLSQSHLQFHASAASRAGVTAMFPAAMNSGKSTLVTGLVRAGWTYVTDETTGLRPASGLVDPYPKAIALDPGSWALFASLEHARAPAGAKFSPNKWHLDPRAIGEVASGPTSLGTVVFPQYQAGAPTTVERLDPADVAVELAQNAFNLAAIGQPGVDLIARIASTVPSYRLASGDLDDVVRTVGELLQSAPTPPAP